jgi:hypothetical protein
MKVERCSQQRRKLVLDRNEYDCLHSCFANRCPKVLGKMGIFGSAAFAQKMQYFKDLLKIKIQFHLHVSCVLITIAL